MQTKLWCNCCKRKLEVSAHLDSLSLIRKNQVRNLGVILDTESDFPWQINCRLSILPSWKHSKNQRIHVQAELRQTNPCVHFQQVRLLQWSFLRPLKKNNSQTTWAHLACCCCWWSPNKDQEKWTHFHRFFHWLRVCQRSVCQFKALLLVNKSLNGSGLKYISDCLLPYEPSMWSRVSR